MRVQGQTEAAAQREARVNLKPHGLASPLLGRPNPFKLATLLWNVERFPEPESRIASAMIVRPRMHRGILAGRGANSLGRGEPAKNLLKRQGAGRGRPFPIGRLRLPVLEVSGKVVTPVCHPRREKLGRFESAWDALVLLGNRDFEPVNRGRRG